MKKILVIHHTDLDGAMSAAVVGLFHRQDQITYRLYNYGWEIKPEELCGYDLVYAVDISFFQSGYSWVFQTPNLIWIDHHIGAIREEQKPENSWISQLPGLRISDGHRAACELTWEFLYPGTLKPLLLQYLSSYDVWDKTRFNWDTVEEVEWGAKQKFGVSPVEIIKYLESPEGNKNNISEFQTIGKILLDYLGKKNKSLVINNGFYIHDFFGYRVMAVCTQDFSSMTFKGVFNSSYFDVMMPFSIVPGINNGESLVRISFYTENPDIDVSLLAKEFGGGGHKGAAGCTTDLKTLEKMIECSSPLKPYLKTLGLI